MLKTYKALSALLCYPSAELKEAAPEIAALLEDENLLSPEARKALVPLLKDFVVADLYDLQERYVLLFDRSRTLSLNLFEHIHGESRERGSAMVDLLETYRAAGFDLHSSELPDHLPIFLEFLSTRPVAEAQSLIEDAGAVIAALAERLQRRETPYAAVLAGLAEMARVPKSSARVAELLVIEDDDPEDLEALDEIWEEAEVTFGPDPNAGCPATRDMLSRMAPVPEKPNAPRSAAAE